MDFLPLNAWTSDCVNLPAEYEQEYNGSASDSNTVCPETLGFNKEVKQE
jgi:hypothetical protein